MSIIWPKNIKDHVNFNFVFNLKEDQKNLDVPKVKVHNPNHLHPSPLLLQNIFLVHSGEFRQSKKEKMLN